MKNVKLSVPILVGTVHREPGYIVSVADGEADQMIAAGAAELSDGKPTPADPTSDRHRVPGSVDPIVTNADPLHAARMLGLVAQDHPGLVAHAEATGAPKRAGRMAPDAVAVADTIPPVVPPADDPKPAPKAKG